MDKITEIYAREILDSRGNPTVEVTVEAGKLTAKAQVPSGASTGSHEACELRDNDATRYEGKGVLTAVDNVNHKIKKALIGSSVENISAIDQLMIDLDGTENKSRLGANAILGTSLACARVAALNAGLPLYKFIRQYFKFKFSKYILPVPLSNLINGGRHASSNLKFQEFWVVPKNIPSTKERVRAISEIFHELGSILLKKKYSTDVGNEGGYAPNVKSADEVWQMLEQAVKAAHYNLGEDVYLGLDAGSSEFYNSKTGKYEIGFDNKALTAPELSHFYQQWLAKYPIIAFEDPFAEDDWPAWKEFYALTSRIHPNISIIGDDLFTTNINRLEQGIAESSCNAILIKPNQIGTLTETIAAIKLAQANDFKIAVSHRSGETEDDFIADLAVAVNSDYLKAGAPSRSERVIKYNRLMAIEEELQK